MCLHYNVRDFPEETTINDFNGDTDIYVAAVCIVNATGNCREICDYRTEAMIIIGDNITFMLKNPLNILPLRITNELVNILSYSVSSTDSYNGTNNFKFINQFQLFRF